MFVPPLLPTRLHVVRGGYVGVSLISLKVVVGSVGRQTERSDISAIVYCQVTPRPDAVWVSPTSSRPQTLDSGFTGETGREEGVRRGLGGV